MAPVDGLCAARRGAAGIGRRAARDGAHGGPAGLRPAGVRSCWPVLGVIAVAALWDRWGPADLVGALLSAATVPCLAAGLMLANRAAASTLRWGLAVAFVVASMAVWQRHRLTGPCVKIRARIAVGAEGPAIARTVCCWPWRCRWWA